MKFDYVMFLTISWDLNFRECYGLQEKDDETCSEGQVIMLACKWIKSGEPIET